VHGHHVGKVVRSRIDAPAVPIEDADVLEAAVARQHAVPDMRIATHDGEIAMRAVACIETRRGSEKRS
jgi:hypothetical protein